jgi:hypothetical protein
VFYYLKKMKNSVQSETLKKSYAEVHWTQECFS